MYVPLPHYTYIIYKNEDEVCTAAGRLDEGLVWDRGQSLWDITFGRDNTSLSWLGWLPLQLNSDTLSLGLSTLSSVSLNSLQELSSALGVLDVLNSQVQSLLNVSVTDHLVNDNTDGGLGNVVDNTSLTVVKLVWHTLLDRTIGLDIDNVTNFVDLQVGGQWDGTILPEVPLEHVTCTRSVTVSV